MEIKLLSKEEIFNNNTEYLEFKEQARKQKLEDIYKREKEILDYIKSKIENVPTVDKFICSLCNRNIPRSEYLSTIFKDDKYAEWAANLVTHYRHQHIRYYDASWKNWRYADKNPEYRKADTHEDYKEIVNNRAKRQLIRGIYKNFSKDIGLNLICGFLKLQSNDEKTLELIDKTIKKVK